jgi:predicted kinase
LYLIRGASGSGKTTLGQKLALNRVISADDFPGLYEKGIYRRELQTVSHQWCLRETEKYLSTGVTVAVANTFSRRKQLEPYLELAGCYGYQTSIITCEGNHGNHHGVTEEIRNRHLATFEPLESLTPFGIEIYLTDLLKYNRLSPEELHGLIDEISSQLKPNEIATDENPSVKQTTEKRGTGEFNESKTNLDRREESAKLVAESVNYLKETNQWHSQLSTRERIKLIQSYTQTTYQRTISSGTLYQPWCKFLWH